MRPKRASHSAHVGEWVEQKERSSLECMSAIRETLVSSSSFASFSSLFPTQIHEYKTSGH